MTTYLNRADLPELTRRHAFSQRTWKAIQLHASAAWTRLDSSTPPETPEIAQRACIYVAGSFARDEAHEGSDLDLFVLDDLPSTADINSKSLGSLTYVENARLISCLDDARAAADVRQFSRGGEILKTHSFKRLLGEIGWPQDDASNAFTARVLLLTGSRPLLNPRAHAEAKKCVLNSYWDRNDPDQLFFPIMLINDLRRWWGELCLNFERNNRLLATSHFESTPRRRSEDLKLRYTKLLGVYSTIFGLIDVAGDRGLIRADAESVFDALPVDRLIHVANNYASSDPEIFGLARRVLCSYDEYLTFSAQPKEILLVKLSDKTVWHERKRLAYAFRDDFVRLLDALGRDRTVYEYCVF